MWTLGFSKSRIELLCLAFAFGPVSCGGDAQGSNGNLAPTGGAVGSGGRSPQGTGGAASTTMGGTSGNGGTSPVAPYQCDTTVLTPDDGPANTADLKALFGIYQVEASTASVSSCPIPYPEPLITTDYVEIGSKTDVDIRVHTCSDSSTCNTSSTPGIWGSGGIHEKAGAGFSGWYLTTSVVDQQTQACTGVYVFRYIVATGTRVHLEERVRLSACGCGSDGDAGSNAMAPCECVGQSYDLVPVP
jgi:hypothetical protein